MTTNKDAVPSDDDVLAHPDTVVARSITRAWTFSPAIVFQLWREIGRADLVHVHSVHTFPSTVAMLVSRLMKKPVVLQPHGALNSYHIAKRRWAKIAYLRSVDCIGLAAVRTVVVSSSVEAAQASSFFVQDLTFTVPLGVDGELLETPREHGSDSVLFLARLAKKKRLDLFLEALASEELRDVIWRATVAGPLDPDLEFAPDERIAELGLQDRVTLVGSVDAEERARLLSSCAVYVLPSDDESFGMSVAEAMAAGCAVLSSPHVGVAVDAAEESGVVIVEQDSNRIATQIGTLLADPLDRDRRAEQSRRYARDHLTWDAIAKRLSHRYASVASEVHTNG